MTDNAEWRTLLIEAEKELGLCEQKWEEQLALALMQVKRWYKGGHPTMDKLLRVIHALIAENARLEKQCDRLAREGDELQARLSGNPEGGQGG